MEIRRILIAAEENDFFSVDPSSDAKRKYIFINLQKF